MGRLSHRNGSAPSQRFWVAPLLALGSLLCGSSRSEASVILWNQSTYTTPQFWDQQFTDPLERALSTYMVSDVGVEGAGWNVSAITVYFTHFSSNWSSVNQAVLNVFSKGASWPLVTDDPTSGEVVSVSATLTLAGDAWAIRADGLSLNLPAGDYWIGLTPIVSFHELGVAWHRAAGNPIGDLSYYRNPDNGFGYGPLWLPASTIGWGDYVDASILVEGDKVPEPGTLLLIGSGLVGLALRRRCSDR